MSWQYSTYAAAGNNFKFYWFKSILMLAWRGLVTPSNYICTHLLRTEVVIDQAIDDVRNLLVHQLDAQLL